MEFVAYGHPNIRATHKTTIEFTKEKDINLEGDCIVCVNSDFNLHDLKKCNNRIKIIVSIGNLKEEINAIFNPGFDDNNELVIRKSDFISNRTFAIKADKAACDLNREIINKLKNPEEKIKITIK